MERAVTLYIVIPCFNEEEVLPVTAPLFLGKISELIKKVKSRMTAGSFLLMTVRKIEPGRLS